MSDEMKSWPLYDGAQDITVHVPPAILHNSELLEAFLQGANENIINLHADLDNRQIIRVIERYKGMDVTFLLDGSDSTPAERTAFRRLWESAGGPRLWDFVE